MNWASPHYFWLLWLVPLVLAVGVFAQRSRNRSALRFVDHPMLSQLAPSYSWLRISVKWTFLTLGITGLVLAMARPQLGFYFEEVTAQGAEVLVLIDVSRSMLAEDVAPSRLARAKSDIVDLLQRMPSDRVGLIAFAGAPSVLVPLTLDHGFFKLVLQDLGPNSAPRGGTNIGDAIRKAIEQFGNSANSDRAIVLITDGGDQDSFPTEAAKLAAERNIRIIAVGLGDPTEGARIPRRDKDGRLTYQQFDGQEVWSKMEDKTLKEIASITSGAYIPAQTRLYDLGEVYTENLKELRRGEMFADKRKRPHERFQIPAVIGLFFLMLERSIARFASRKESQQ